MQYWKRGKKRKVRRPRRTQTDVLPNPVQINKTLEEKAKLQSTGVAIHSVVNRRTSSVYLTQVKDYSDANLQDRTKIVQLSRDLRSKEGICSTVADLLVDFGATKGKFYCDNEELQTLLNRWAEFVNLEPQKITNRKVNTVPGLREVTRKIIDRYITDGDAVFTLFWDSNVRMDVLLDKKKGYTLPVSINILDSLSLEIDEDLAKLGFELIELKLDDDLKKKIKEPKTKQDKEAIKSLPKEWVKAVRNGDKIYLDPAVTYHIKRNSRDFSPWGEPLFLKAFTAIANKRRLQAVDEATIDGLINRFTVFKLGLPDKEKNTVYHVPSPARVQQLVEILTNPKRANAIVWPGPDLEIDDIGPDGKILEFVDKYKQADLDIIRALHIPLFLIDGSTPVKDWSIFLSTEIGLDAIRDAIEKIYTNIAKDIAIANEFKYSILKYKFETQIFQDERRIRNFALKVYELGGISTETFVNIMGYDFNIEKLRKEKELESGVHEVFVNRSLPFQGRPPLPSEDPPDNTENKDVAKGQLRSLWHTFKYKFSEAVGKSDTKNELLDTSNELFDEYIHGVLSLLNTQGALQDDEKKLMAHVIHTKVNEIKELFMDAVQRGELDEDIETHIQNFENLVLNSLFTTTSEKTNEHTE